MPPKASKNSFAALRMASEPGESGTRETKKIQRAIEHRRRKSEERHHRRHSGHSAAPFFTLAVEANNTAVALDANGNELVSVKFDDYDDLVSDSFREYIRQAAMAAEEQRRGEAPMVEVIEISSSSDDDTTTSNSSTAEIDDIDVLFELLLGGLSDELLRDLAATSIHGGDEETLDADLALALRLQEEEEEAATKATQAAKKRVGGAWASSFHKNQSTISSVLGTAPGVQLPNRDVGTIAQRAANEDFPALAMAPPLTSLPPPSSKPSSSNSGKRVSIYTSMAASRSKGVRVLNKSASSRSNSGDMDLPSSNQQFHSELEAMGYRKVDDDLANSSMFLNSYNKDAVKARAGALKWMEQAAEKDARNEERAVKDHRHISSNSGPSSEAIRRMMDSCKSVDSTEGVLGDEIDDNGAIAAIERSEYCRKSIRKLVNDMIGAGWRPLIGRGGGHYVYERLVGPNCVKQLLVLPSTPSDRRSIRAVHARLQKMDREAAEIKAKAGVV